jgi:hypothetical protein
MDPVSALIGTVASVVIVLLTVVTCLNWRRRRNPSSPVAQRNVVSGDSSPQAQRPSDDNQQSTQMQYLQEQNGELYEVRPRLATNHVDSLYESLSSMQPKSSGSVKYVPVDRADAGKEQLYVQISTVSGSSCYAEVAFDNKFAANQLLFRAVVEDIEEDADFMPNSPPQQQLDSGALAPVTAGVANRTVYANAESIVRSLTIPASELKLGETIGTGAFGDVVVATWTPRGSAVGIKVAVKRVKISTASDQAKQSFLKEISTVAQLTHTHIVQVLGVALDPPLIALEYIDGGSVYSWLQSANRAPPLATLMNVAHQTAVGMAYLASHHVVHRDVAARNVLIRFVSDVKFICKITDFGLSQVFSTVEGQSSDETSPIPVRWTAPEVSSV